MLQIMNKTNVFGAVQNSASSSSSISNFTKRLAVLTLLLLTFVLGARAADYVITYTSGGTTYYLGMNGNSLQAKTTFDPTCIWECCNGVDIVQLSNRYSYSLRNRNNSEYYLTTSCTQQGNWNNYTYTWGPLSVQTSASNIWRSSNATNGNVYAYYSFNYGQNRSASINVQSLTMIDNNTNSSKNGLVTITQVSTTSTNPTINGDDVLTATGNYTYTASGATYQAGYVNYKFNNTDHDFDNNNTAITHKAATLSGTAWSISANEYATISGSGVVTVNSIPTSDITLTIIATVSVTGGTPAAPAGTTLVGTKEITIQGSVPAAPTISVSGTTVTLQTDATGTTSIRYTIDGTDPTATTGTVYNGAFDISGSTNSPVTIKAITVRNGNASSATTQQVKLTLPEPVIKVNAETGTATITCSNNSATIYYTTDGSTPSATNGTPYNGQITGLATMATVKAIAICDGWNSSSVASATVTIPSGVSGGTVTLFDYEDHNWSYYSDAECPIHSLNPADVKITYYGNGTKTVTNASAAEAVENPTSFSLDATTVKVGPNDDANVFVYYKTLERENVNGTGDLVYTTIPNPFLVRPTGNSGSAPTTVSITIEGYGSRDGATGSVLCTYFNASGDQESESININGTTTRTAEITAKIGTEITFTLTRTSNNRTVYFSAYYTEGKGEIASGSRNQTGSQNFGPFTISASSDANNYRGFYAWRVKSKSEGLSITDVNGNSFANNIIPAEAEIRFVTSNEYGNEVEFEALWAQAYVTDGTSDLSTRSNSYERNFHVVKSATSASSFQKSYPLTVTSYYPDGTSAGGSVTGGFTAAADTKFENITISNATNSTWTANGHDLIVGRGCSGTVGTVRGMSGGSSNAVNYTIRLESGTFGTFNMIDGTTYTHSGTVSAKTIFGCDYDRANKDNDKLSISNNSTVYGASSYQEFASSNNRNNLTYDWLIKSGKVQSSKSVADAAAENCIYMGNTGSSNNTDGNKYQGKRRLIMEGGEVCNIAGGLNNYGSNRNNYIVNDGGWTLQIRMKGGTVRGSIYGAAAFAGASGDRLFIFTGGTIGGWVAGGANGTQDDGGVLHGASYLYVGGNTQIDSKASEDVINRAVGGNVFGAGCGYNSGSESGQVTQGTNVIVADGAYVERGVYGGGSYGYTTATSNIYILGGTVGGKSGGASGTNYLAAIDGGVYGGACQNQGGTVNIIMNGGTVNGSVYGGSNYTGTLSGTSTVTLNGGTINGSLYGGGNGEGSANTNVTGAVQVRVYGGTVTDAVYGCNNNAGSPQSSVTVDIYGTDPAPAEGEYALHAVYGGGNKAPYSGIPIVTVHECDNSIEYVYGGGNAASVQATDVTIWGGNTIGNVFGGGNGAVSAANVSGNATTKIYGGTILNVYGGSNSQGTIGGAINVTVNSQAENSGDSPCTMNIGDVYGGGNRAASKVGNLNIVCTGTDGYIDRVFGGANAAEITGDVELEINGGNIGSVFGGNNSEKSISGNVTVNIGKAPNSCGVFEIGNVHGGGYGEATGVKGNVEVNIAGGTINGDVYGGSALGKVNTNTNNTTKVNLTGGIIHGDAYGGGLGARGIAADVNGNVTVTLDGTAFVLATTTDDNGDTIPTSGRVFGCNNINGSPKGTVLVQVLSTVAKNGDGTSKDKQSGVYELQAVYGGGNLAAYNPTNPKATGQYTYTFNSDTYGEVNFTAVEKPVQVVIDGCGLTSIEYVYGGGNAAPTPATDVIVLGSYEIGNVFGGGNGKDKYKLDGGSTWYENPGADVGIRDSVAYKNNHEDGLYGTGKSKASVLGGTVHNLFGASNTKGNVVKESLAYVDNANICELNVGGIYGGGNEAYMDGNSQIELGCIKALEEIYGGARNADVKGDIDLTISSGHFDRVFGGNNIGGTIDGSITVTIKETGCNPITIGELYGCGNQAAYTTPKNGHDPIINLISFTSIGNVFGGGLGASADVTGNPTVNINVEDGDHVNVEYKGKTIDFGDDYKVTLPLHKAGEIGAIGTVYGGGNAAAVIGSTTVNMTYGIVENTLFGGGNAADVEGDTEVTILDGTIGGNVYGGGNRGDVTGKTKVQIGQPTP